MFDPGQNGTFSLDSPPAPWLDLGWISGFLRTSATTVLPVKTGAPVTTQLQVRTDIEASVKFAFESWGKLQLSLAAGTQQMNVLAVQSGSALAGSGGAAIAAVPVGGGSTATALNVGAASTNFAVGSVIAVDLDYATGVTGLLGSGVSGAYLRAAVTDIDFIRRITLNVARVTSIDAGVLTLERPLVAGAPSSAMKVSSVVGFCDREGSSFFQEWSALFVGEGQQGERVIWHYPRLQSASGICEEVTKGAAGYQALRLAGSFRALPVTDPVDGEHVVCFRTYVNS